MSQLKRYADHLEIVDKETKRLYKIFEENDKPVCETYYLSDDGKTIDSREDQEDPIGSQERIEDGIEDGIETGEESGEDTGQCPVEKLRVLGISID